MYHKDFSDLSVCVCVCFSLYQCLVEEGQLLQQFVHSELDWHHVARRCHRAHVDDAVIQKYLHSTHTHTSVV